MSASALLALESGGAMASAALIDAQGKLSYESAESGQSHSSQLLPMAKRLLESAGLQWCDLKGIVAGIGPGSFTGLRIACSLVQGLAMGAQKQVLPVSSFEAWAYAWWLKWGHGKNQCVNISFDARLGERFAAAVSVAAQADAIELRWAKAPQVVAQGAWIATPSQWTATPACGGLAVTGPQGDMAFRNDGLNVAERCSTDAAIRLDDPDSETLGLEPLPLAAWMVRLASDPRVMPGLKWIAPSALAPLYVREKVAQTIAERNAFPDLAWHTMRHEDIDAVMAIENKAYPFPWTAGNFRDSITAGYEAWLLKEHGTIIGYMVWMKVVDEAHLLNITLSPARQGHGLGSWMMRHFLAQSQAQRLGQLMLEVRPSNPKAISMYRKFGFEQIGLRKGYYPAGPKQREDAVVMRLGVNRAAA
jgi:tRNA threonylcarbamoyladenosine biosynthesis protein TsaB